MEFILQNATVIGFTIGLTLCFLYEAIKSFIEMDFYQWKCRHCRDFIGHKIPLWRAVWCMWFHKEYYLENGICDKCDRRIS